MKQRHNVGRAGCVGPALVIWLLMFAIALTIGRTAAAQAQNGIREPQEGDHVSGIVVVRGTATDDDFLRYELAFSDGGDWLLLAEGDRPVVDDTLAVWDTTVGQPDFPAFPDGLYHLRLRVVRQDRNYSEYFVRNLTLSNRMTPTPTPTATATATEQAAAQTVTVQPGGTPVPEVQFGRPTTEPSLTPFPTPSPAATPRSLVQGEGAGGLGDPPMADEGGLLGQIAATGPQRFSRAFLLGAGVAFCGFMLLPLYLLVRGLLRWGWRLFRSRVLR